MICRTRARCYDDGKIEKGRRDEKEKRTRGQSHSGTNKGAGKTRGWSLAFSF